MILLIDGLTEHQSKAVFALQKTQEGKMFSGISISFVIIDFKAVTALRATDSTKADSNEQALFALCGYDPSNTS